MNERKDRPQCTMEMLLYVHLSSILYGFEKVGCASKIKYQLKMLKETFKARITFLGILTISTFTFYGIFTEHICTCRKANKMGC